MSCQCLLCRVRATPCSIPKGGLECVPETMLGKKFKKEGTEGERQGPGKGEERKGGRKRGETDRGRDWKESQQKLSDFAPLVAVVA